MKFEILKGLPPYGDLPVQFDENPTGSEGLVVKFCPKVGQPWIGNFLRGYGSLTGVFDHPNPRYSIVIAAGEGYVVETETKALIDSIGSTISVAFQLEREEMIIFIDDTDFRAFSADGMLWRRRVSWDGFKDLERDGRVVSGKAWAPDEWLPFSINLITGEQTGGPIVPG